MRNFGFLLFLVSLLAFASCGNRESASEPINSRLLSYIQTNCSSQPCQIKLANVTGFEWDKFYVFEITVEDDQVSKTIDSEFSSKSPYYSRKWFFIKDNRVVRSEEHPLPEIDVPVKNGDVLFEMASTESDSSSFGNDAVFQVKRNELDGGVYYSLRCVKGCRPAGSATSNQSPPSDESIIYSVVAKDAARFPSAFVTTTSLDEYATKWIGNPVNGLPSDAVQDFMAANADEIGVSSETRLPNGSIWITKEEAIEASAPDDAVGWKRFTSGHPGMTRILYFSPVGFDRDRSVAILYVSMHCGWTCGSVDVYRLKRLEGDWQIETRRTISMA